MADAKRDRKYADAILSAISDGVFAVDENFTITLFNPAAETITGISAGQAIGEKCFDVLRADICQTNCTLKRTYRDRRPIVDERVDILDGEGRSVPISISTGMIHDDNGRVVGGVESFRDLSDVEALRREIDGRYRLDDIVARSPAMRKLFAILPDVAVSQSTVLIEGASGTGKELFARAIHNLSPRHEGPYVAVNCAALPESLLESELFGYVKGAFTDARADKPGRFQLAEGGTILLDEIGDMPPALQAKLLRVLQERCVEPLGAVKSRPVDVRVIAATNRRLDDLVAEKRFREDLFYRLNVVRFSLPPLKDRREDIPLLAEHLITKLNASKGRHIDDVSKTVMVYLMRHDFPGNVRELENILEYAFVLCRGHVIEASHLPEYLLEKPVNHLVNLPEGGSIPEEKPSHQAPLEQAETDAIRLALERNAGSRRATAKELGIHPSTLWRKMKRYGLDGPFRKDAS